MFDRDFQNNITNTKEFLRDLPTPQVIGHALIIAILSSTTKDMTDFFDVTFACDNEHIQAHKAEVSFVLLPISDENQVFFPPYSLLSPLNFPAQGHTQSWLCDSVV